MNNSLAFLHVFIPFLILSLCTVPTIHAEQEDAHENYQLSIDFDLQKNQLTGTAKITIRANQQLTLSLNKLRVTGSLLKAQNGDEKTLVLEHNVLTIPESDQQRELYISYIRKMGKSFENIISPEGISLVSNWHPIPNRPMNFMLVARLPDGFTAVSESDLFPLQQAGDTITTTFTTPLLSLHFAAGPYHHQSIKVREGLMVHTLFFQEDKLLADSYLKAAARYIERYESEIDTFPYNHYVIAANRLPTGFGFPGFTLIGQMVLRLPFIKETSLGHEILHSWFGNSVSVDYREGNWCEGLTSYLADHSYRAEKGEGIQDRKETIANYLNYTDQDDVIPLSEFYSASHNQPQAKAIRAVGYAKSAMFFHELKEKIGDQPFKEAIRTFFTENSGRTASWSDLQRNLEVSSQLDLSGFFRERLLRKEIPSVAVENIEVNYQGHHPVLSFTLVQKTQEPFTLVVPIAIKTATTSIFQKEHITDKRTEITIRLNSLPIGFTIDPEYSFLRQLSEGERVARWSSFLGSRKTLIIIGSLQDKENYDSLLQSFDQSELTLKLEDTVTNQELGESNLLFLGTTQNVSKTLFGDHNQNMPGFTLDVRKNPLNPQLIAVLASGSDKSEIDAVARRLSHYGKYSSLRFLHGRIQQKTINPSQSGMVITLEMVPDGGKTSSISSFEQIIEELSRSRVIYVGESHTSYADHLLQLRLIEALYKHHPKIAIGMEMFPANKQPALDSYTLGTVDMDEKTFLRESEYFKVWRYDYRFFRDIINFAKTHSLPVVGLNLEKKIVSNVFRSGNTDTLEKKVKELLPKERDLDIPGYKERLSIMHNVHLKGSHGAGKFSGFIQAQGLWDETMAANIVQFLQSNPEYKMIVLAGAQHTRKDYGIPPRVKRRIDIEQSSVINIYSHEGHPDLARVADYFFLAEPIELPQIPKIGVILLAGEKDGQKFLTINKLSPNGQAGAAGLLEGDILIAIDGAPIEEMGDVQIAMLDTKEGGKIGITVLRNNGDKDEEMEFTVTLSSLELPMEHP